MSARENRTGNEGNAPAAVGPNEAKGFRGDERVIEPLAVGIEGLAPFLVPVLLFACGFVGYLVLVAVTRWVKGD